MRADLVYSDEDGNVFAEGRLDSGKVLYAVPDGEDDIVWIREKRPLGVESHSVLMLLGKAFQWNE